MAKVPTFEIGGNDFLEVIAQTRYRSEHRL